MARKIDPLEPFRLGSGKKFQIYNGDVFEVLAAMPEKCVDMIFADPPYNLSNDGFTVHAGKRVKVNKGEWDRSKGVEADFEFHYRWLEACRRVLKEDGTIWVSGTYHSIYACGFALQKQGWHILNDIAWFKPNASPNLSCRMFTASHETILWARKSKKSRHLFNYTEMKEGNFDSDVIKRPGKQMRSVWSIGFPSRNEKRYGKHPTQKPELLLDRIIRAGSSKGQTILDPFCGSGTTGVAALLNGRKFIGIDAQRSYLDQIAIPRLLDAETPNFLSD
jgi:site-specific DNA-methyltransferase (adenine-specific)